MKELLEIDCYYSYDRGGFSDHIQVITRNHLKELLKGPASELWYLYSIT